MPVAVGGAHPDGVAFAGRRRPARRLAAVDLLGLGVEEGAVEEALRRRRQPVRIGDDAVAHPEGALGRLDQPVDVVEAFRLADPQPLEQRQDDQRGEPLGRRRRVVERAGLQRDAERLGDARAVLRRDRRGSPGCRCGRDRPRSRGRCRRDRSRRAPHGRGGRACRRAPPGASCGRRPAACRRPGRSRAKPGTPSSSASFSAVSRAWLRVTT